MSAPIFEISTFEDLVRIAYSNQSNKDVKELAKIKRPLRKLKNMIGLDDLKQQIINQILFCVQGFHTGEMLHTALMGPPGVGKTSIAHILADIYKSLGILSKGKLIVVSREDLVGQYLGETALKTQSVLEHAIGNVLFIDEAYSLGNTGSNDSYSKECIDTITKFIGEHTKDFICIIAGYENELKDCFFRMNPGLDRRFPWKYTIQPYKANQLVEIYLKMTKRNGWNILNVKDSKHTIINLFMNKTHYFSNNGGDVQNFVNCCKMIHGRRVFGGCRKSWKKYLSIHDIEKGFTLFQINKPDKVNVNQMLHMYT